MNSVGTCASGFPVPAGNGSCGAAKAEPGGGPGQVMSPSRQAKFAGVFARALTPRRPGDGSSRATEPASPEPPDDRAEQQSATEVAAGTESPAQQARTTDALRSLIELVAADVAAQGDAGAAAASPAVAGTDKPAAEAGTRSDEDSKGDGAAPDDPADVTRLDAGLGMAGMDPALVVRDMSALQPAFREKLERVMSRMKEEFGHDVTIAETWRSQARQEFLHEQGRTRAGSVVTWTRHSQHAEGRAADLMVDGLWDNPLGFERLQQVAREEGLHTLGARDPGHIEMAGDSSIASISRTARITELLVSQDSASARGSAGAAALAMVEAAGAREDVRRADSAGRAQVPRVAQVAQVLVAQVARVAEVARVAQIAQVAQAAQTTLAAQAAQTVQAAQAAADAPERPSASRDESRALRAERRSDAADGFRQEMSDGARDLAGARNGGITATRQPAGTPAPASILTTSAAMRASHVLDLQSARAAQPVSHMVLRVDDGQGGEDSVRVDLRGTRVDATIRVNDAADAARMAGRVGELASALEARGLGADALRIQSNAAVAASPSDLSRFAQVKGDGVASQIAALASDASVSGPRARDEARGDTHGQRPQHDPSRNRSRGERKRDDQ